MTTSGIDMLKLTLNLGGNRETVHRMLKLYLSTAEAALEQLAAAPDLAAWKTVAHTIKGTSKNIAALHMAALAEEAETLEEWPAPAHHLSRMQEELNALQNSVTKLLAI